MKQQTQPFEYCQWIELFKKKDTIEILQYLFTIKTFKNNNAQNTFQSIRNSLIKQLDNFQEIEKQHIKKHFICDQLKTYLEYFCGDNIDDNEDDQHNRLIKMKNTYIGYLQSTIVELIQKAKKWRIHNKSCIKRICQQSKVNRLLYQSYNIKNYIEQLQLVKDLKIRVEKMLSLQTPQICHFQELARKKNVPYTFYSNYCLTNCCKVIEKRIKSQQLVILTHSAITLQLFGFMKRYFFKEKSLSQKCGLFVSFDKFIRIFNKNNIWIENGFTLSFKPYFIQSMTENLCIQKIDYLKARSIMQSNQQFIDIWREYQSIRLQEYKQWNNQKIKDVQRIQNVHIQTIKQTIEEFHLKYEWIEELKINRYSYNLKVFLNNYLIEVICKIIFPLLLHLYFSKMSQLEIKKLDINRIIYNKYWVYWIFHKYRKLYLFISPKINDMVSRFNQNQRNSFKEKSQLNLQQYYTYYKQLSQVLQTQIREKKIGEQFSDFFIQVVLKISQTLPSNKQKIQIIKNMQSYYESIILFQKEQAKIISLISSTKNYSSDSIQEQLYTSLMRLNFNTANYFLIQRITKILGKKVEKQIQLIRQVAYNQFYK